MPTKPFAIPIICLILMLPLLTTIMPVTLRYNFFFLRGTCSSRCSRSSSPPSTVRIRTLTRGKENPEAGARVDEALIVFSDWMQEHNITLNGVEVRSYADGTRKVIATRDLMPDEIIVRIPYDTMVTDSFRSEDPVVQQAAARLSGNVALAVIILRERNNTKSWMKPYLDLFPLMPNNFPAFYNSTERALLKGTSLLRTLPCSHLT